MVRTHGVLRCAFCSSPSGCCSFNAVHSCQQQVQVLLHTFTRPHDSFHHGKVEEGTFWIFTPQAKVPFN